MDGIKDQPQWEEIYQRLLRENGLVDSFALRQGFMLGWNNGLDWYAQELLGRVLATEKLTVSIPNA